MSYLGEVLQWSLSLGVAPSVVASILEKPARHVAAKRLR